MFRLFGFLFFVIVFGFFSCSGNSGAQVYKADSIASYSSKKDSVKTDSVSNSESSGTISLDTLLPHLSLLKFPLTIDVDSFEKKEGVQIPNVKRGSWFEDVPDFSSEAKIKAVGKFYVDQETIAILFYITFPNDYPDHPDEQELILGLFEAENETMTSCRILSIGADEDYGNSIMKSADTGKIFVEYESEDINIKFQNFTIKDGTFVLGESVDKTFAGNQKGSDSSIVAINDWMK